MITGTRISRLLGLASAALLLMMGCGAEGGSGRDMDDRFVVLGPSLVELMFTCGLGDRVVGVDRYSQWPPEVESLPRVGGYVDPSLEAIVELSPTSIHVSGENATLAELASQLGIPCYRYDFDSLDGFYEALDSLASRYGAGAEAYLERLNHTLDSLRSRFERLRPVSVMVAVYHEPGSSSMTVAGKGTFYDGLLNAVGCNLSAPGTGTWPEISAEGVLDLDPDHVVLLFPDARDSSFVRETEVEFWESLGFGKERVHCLFEPFIMIPGGRMDMIAERICSCLL